MTAEATSIRTLSTKIRAHQDQGLRGQGSRPTYEGVEATEVKGERCRFPRTSSGFSAR